MESYYKLYSVCVNCRKKEAHFQGNALYGIVNTFQNFQHKVEIFGKIAKEYSIMCFINERECNFESKAVILNFILPL